MAVGISLRDDFDAAGLRGLAKRCKDAGMARRLLALATIYDGGSRTDAARIGDVGLQTVRSEKWTFWKQSLMSPCPDMLPSMLAKFPEWEISIKVPLAVSQAPFNAVFSASQVNIAASYNPFCVVF